MDTQFICISWPLWKMPQWNSTKFAGCLDGGVNINQEVWAATNRMELPAAEKVLQSS